MSQADSQFSLETLVFLTQKLTALINKETESLKLMKISDIAALQDEKNVIAGQLEKQQTALKADPSIRDNLEDGQRFALKQSAIEFDAAIQIYQKELYKAKKVNEMIICKVVEIVKEHVTKNRSYNYKGSKNLSGTELAKNTPALKYNTQA